MLLLLPHVMFGLMDTLQRLFSGLNSPGLLNLKLQKSHVSDHICSPAHISFLVLFYSLSGAAHRDPQSGVTRDLC